MYAGWWMGFRKPDLRMKLAHPLGLFMITGAKVKTDKRDAFVLARLLRLDAIPEAYIYPRNKRAIRDLLRKRHRLVARRAVEYFALRKLISNSIVTHKLTIAAYHVLKKQEPFREELMFRAFQEA